MSPFDTEDAMNNIIITPDEHTDHHFRRTMSRYPRAPHHSPRQVMSMRDLSSISISEDSMLVEEDYHNDGTPSTPPSANKSMFAMPPEVPRHGRPINRRLFLQEAQDRLSLPDLFAPRSSMRAPHRSTPVRGASRTRRMQQRHRQTRPSLVSLQPRTISWGESYDETEHGHSMSQRDFFCTNPAEY